MWLKAGRQGKTVFFSTHIHIVPHRQYIENEGPAREVQWSYGGQTIVYTDFILKNNYYEFYAAMWQNCIFFNT